MRCNKIMKRALMIMLLVIKSIVWLRYSPVLIWHHWRSHHSQKRNAKMQKCKNTIRLSHPITWHWNLHFNWRFRPDSCGFLILLTDSSWWISPSDSTGSAHQFNDGSIGIEAADGWPTDAAAPPHRFPAIPGDSRRFLGAGWSIWLFDSETAEAVRRFKVRWTGYLPSFHFQILFRRLTSLNHYSNKRFFPSFSFYYLVPFFYFFRFDFQIQCPCYWYWRWYYCWCIRFCASPQWIRSENPPQMSVTVSQKVDKSFMANQIGINCSSGLKMLKNLQDSSKILKLSSRIFQNLPESSWNLNLMNKWSKWLKN